MAVFCGPCFHCKDKVLMGKLNVRFEDKSWVGHAHLLWHEDEVGPNITD